MINMYNILNLLYTNGAKSKLVAATQKQIQEELGSYGTNVCERTVYNTIRKLSKEGLIEEGMTRRNAKTYYISSKGIAWMRDMETEVSEDE